MPTNKNQHFLPQHYLRLFSCDGGKNVAITRIEPLKFVVGSISGQCQEDWFYRDDGELDDWLKETEGAYGDLLPKIIRTKTLDDEQRMACHFLAALFCVRTKKAAQVHGLFTRRVFFDVVNEGIKRGEVPPAPPDWSMDTVAVKGVSGFLVKHVLFECFLEMTTLQCKLIEPNLGSYFITSDHPAVCMNQLFQRESGTSGRSYAGFSRAGFQLVLPVSPTLGLFFYDPKVYKVGSKRDRLVTLSDEDVEIVNSLQVQNADKCLYSNHNNDALRLESLVGKFARLRVPSSELLQVISLNEKSDLYYSKSPTALCARPWSFCRLQRHPRVDASRRRDPVWSNLVSAFIEQSNKTNPSDVMEEFISFTESYGR
jgi:hypothetical protein